MGQIEIHKQVEINRSADEVWKILSDGFTNVGSWASAVEVSRPNPNAGVAIAGAPAAGRVCTATGFGDINERITAHDSSARTLTYEATASKIPGFVKDLRNRWTVKSTGEGRSVATSVLTANATGVMGALMAPMMTRKFAGTIETTVQDLKTYAETGSPSASKTRAMAKAG